MSIIKFFATARNRFLLGIFTLFILTAFFAVKHSILAQVSNYVFHEGVSVESSSDLKQKPSDIGSHETESRANVSDMRSQAGSANENLPDEVVYDQIFRHIKELNKKADEEERLGKDGSHLRELYKNMAGLTNQESTTLNTIAAKTNKEIAVLDIQARTIITALRAQTPEGKLQQGQEPPAPPAELVQLSNRRIEIILQAKSDLEAQLGTEGFAKFDSFVEEKVKPGINPLN